MNRRNLIWLAIIVAVVIVLATITNIWWGLAGGAVTLVVSETVERIARKRRGGSAGLVLPSAKRTTERS